MSVRLFGFSSWSVLAPQAIMGILAVLLTYLTVRRTFGALAGLIAGSALALSLRPGVTVLIPGVGGSVGYAAIQLARVHGAGRIITSAGRTEKAERARSLGYEDVIDLSQESLTEGLMRPTDDKGADVALDSVGGPITEAALKALSPGGRVIRWAIRREPT